MGGKIVPFAGWSMPIQFAGLMEEHRCVRERVGLFDVSHMGEVEIKGPEAEAFLQALVTNDVSTMADGAILYSVMCYDNGGIVDDLLIHRHNPEHFFLCVNASNTDKDFDWIVKQAEPFDVAVGNTSDQIAQLALQGPLAEAVLAPPTATTDLSQIAYYHFASGQVGGIDCVIARTGYTGEDGFELYTNATSAIALAGKLFEVGKAHGIQPIGLGARDTLRLEMGYALYGNDIDADTNPLEARLGWVVKLKKENDFVGKAALLKIKETGVPRKLVGLKFLERGVPRSHYKILREGKTVGEITSGTFSPTLNIGIAMGFVPADSAKTGQRFEIDVRGRGVPAEVVPLPFAPSRVKKS